MRKHAAAHWGVGAHRRRGVHAWWGLFKVHGVHRERASGAPGSARSTTDQEHRRGCAFAEGVHVQRGRARAYRRLGRRRGGRGQGLSFELEASVPRVLQSWGWLAPGRERPAARKERAVGWVGAMGEPHLRGLGPLEGCPALGEQPPTMEGGPAPRLSASEQQVLISFHGACRMPGDIRYPRHGAAGAGHPP